jgi:hypothetical protein
MVEANRQHGANWRLRFLYICLRVDRDLRYLWRAHYAMVPPDASPKETLPAPIAKHVER